jgi:hypothetical protein
MLDGGVLLDLPERRSAPWRGAAATAVGEPETSASSPRLSPLLSRTAEPLRSSVGSLLPSRVRASLCVSHRPPLLSMPGKGLGEILNHLCLTNANSSGSHRYSSHPHRGAHVADRARGHRRGQVFTAPIAGTAQPASKIPRVAFFTTTSPEDSPNPGAPSPPICPLSSARSASW